MSLDITDAQATHVVECSTQSNSIGHIRCTSLKTSWRLIVFGVFYSHILNHIATTLPGLHLVEQFLTPVHHPDTVRTIDLMAAEHEEIGSQLLHIHRGVGDRLCTVDEHRNLV